MFTNKNLMTAVAASAIAGLASAAPVSLDSFNSWRDSADTFNAGGSDKLVVIVTAEHGFGANNNGIFLNGIAYDGVPMVPIIQYEGQVPNPSPDQQHHHMYYLDNPANGTGVITFDGNLTRYAVTAFGLSGTAAGFSQAAQENGVLAPGAESIDMLVSADSLVIAGMGMGGDGNTYSGGASADAPLTQRSVLGERNWNGHVTGTHSVGSTGLQTYSFSGNPSAVVNTIVAEFAAVPEPSSLALLGLGGLMIARRRRG